MSFMPENAKPIKCQNYDFLKFHAKLYFHPSKLMTISIITKLTTIVITSKHYTKFNHQVT